MFAAITGQGWAALAHPFNLEINGIDRIAAVQFPTIDIDMPGPGSNGSMTFQIEDPDSSIDVEKWDEVRYIEHAAVRPVTFGGFVQSRQFRAWAAGGRTITVRCVGYGILLDRKAVPGWVLDLDENGEGVVDWITSIVNRHGGRITGLTPPLGGTDFTTAEWSIARRFTWDYEYDAAAGELAWGFPAASLRGMVDELVRRGSYITTNGNYPAAAAYWVDGYARFRLHPDPHPVDPTANFAAQAFDGGTPGLALDLTGASIVSDLEYEDEDSDRLTGAYVESGLVRRVGTATASTTRLLAATSMVDGAYVLDNLQPAWGGRGVGFIVSVSHTAVSTVDDLGSLLVTGVDLFGRVQTESISIEANGKAFGSQVWDMVTRIESRDWEANAGADTISVGHRKGVWGIGIGTGYWRTTPIERAGDLETLVSDQDAMTSGHRDTVARAAVGESEGATARGRVTVGSDGPADIRPGMHLTVTAPQVEQDGTTDWRITSVRIRFTSQTYREYEIGYGGTVPAPSLARRLRTDRGKQAIVPGRHR